MRNGAMCKLTGRRADYVSNRRERTVDATKRACKTAAKKELEDSTARPAVTDLAAPNPSGRTLTC
jgi:hypothetical protein